MRLYHDFLDNSFLTTEEQMIFIVLKSYVDFRADRGEIYPSMKTICKRAKMSEKRARKNINSLIGKGIIKKVQRGLTKTNLYTLSDYATMWACDNVEDAAAIADNQGVKALTPAEHIAELERMGYKVEIVEIKEKGLDTEPSKAQSQAPKLNNTNQFDTTPNSNESQDMEQYSLNQIRQLFDYDAMIQDNQSREQEIDSVMNILYKALNTTKDTIRIAGEDRPTIVVIGRLMKLTQKSIIYAIDKFSEQTERIKNPSAYMLTILYNAPEQYHLDLKNKTSHETAKTDTSQEEKSNLEKENIQKTSYYSFGQRTYDYAKLEKELVNRPSHKQGETLTYARQTVPGMEQDIAIDRRTNDAKAREDAIMKNLSSLYSLDL